MQAIIGFAGLLVTVAVVVWFAGKRAARAELKLKQAEIKNKADENAYKILADYINMSDDDVSKRVREKISKAKSHGMHD